MPQLLILGPCLLKTKSQISMASREENDGKPEPDSDSFFKLG